MTYLDGPRFVVRELEGWANWTQNSKARPGLCVSVIDRAYCGAVMRRWVTEERGGKISAWMKRLEVQSAAERFASDLNTKHEQLLFPR